ncbi:hypothetical protein PsYK624_088300 [Phanerochaete sordida]|uniref:Malate dehydrogenase n=1 Tax=Phanerochaete sordida TaxID=48140 RepID=A0A9P3GDD2_9APHY|nr:hypothetical protein PsYK624_088300 [Phanerochaete sordida]
MFSTSIVACLAALLAVSAAPASRSECSTAGDTLNLPGSTSALPAPPAGDPSFIALGVGVQNYTCGATGTYTSTGAVAELFNLACADESAFNIITDVVSAAWQAAPASFTPQELISDLAVFHPAIVLGQHYFIANPTGGLSPKWDFTSASLAGHPDAFVVGARTGDVPAPTNPAVNVDWLSLKNASGDLATAIYRVQTRGGQPPTSCTLGTPDISVRYVSQYWFYGGSFAG